MNIPVDQQEYKSQLIADPNIQKVIMNLKLTDQEIDQNLSILSQYLRVLNQDPVLPKGSLNHQYDIVINKHENGLSLDYQLKEEFLIAEEKKLQKEKEYQHLNNFWINHLSDSAIYFTKDKLNYTHYLNEKTLFRILELKINDKGLYVYGPIGIGKTLLLSFKAQEFASDGHSVCFVNFNRLLSELKQSFQSDNQNMLYKIMNQMTQCDFLVIDDIGTEFVSAWSRDEILFQILDYRMNHQKLTCFTSNLSRDDLVKHLCSTPVVDEINIARLMERFDVLSDFVLLSSKRESLRRV